VRHEYVITFKGLSAPLAPDVLDARAVDSQRLTQGAHEDTQRALNVPQLPASGTPNDGATDAPPTHEIDYSHGEILATYFCEREEQLTFVVATEVEF